MKKKGYYAAPLFSHMELEYNSRMVERIRQSYPHLDLYVPQENGDINDKSAYADSIIIAKHDTDALLAADVMIAILDGQTMDVGVATEIGVAFQAGIPVVALFSDSRQQGASNAKKLAALQEVAESQFPYVNLYTVGLIKTNGIVVNNPEALVEQIGIFLNK